MFSIFFVLFKLYELCSQKRTHAGVLLFIDGLTDGIIQYLCLLTGHSELNVESTFSLLK